MERKCGNCDHVGRDRIASKAICRRYPPTSHVYVIRGDEPTAETHGLKCILMIGAVNLYRKRRMSKDRKVDSVNLLRYRDALKDYGVSPWVKPYIIPENGYSGTMSRKRSNTSSLSRGPGEASEWYCMVNTGNSTCFKPSTVPSWRFTWVTSNPDGNERGSTA